MDVGGIIVAVVAASATLGAAWFNTRVKVRESKEELNQNIGIKVQESKVEMKENIGAMEEKLVNRMESQIQDLTAQWIAANDESEIKNVRIVWLQESLEKCRRDMAHFDRRSGDRGPKEPDK